MMLAVRAKYQEGKEIPEGVKDAMLEEIRKHLVAYGFTKVDIYYSEGKDNEDI